MDAPLSEDVLDTLEESEASTAVEEGIHANE